MCVWVFSIQKQFLEAEKASKASSEKQDKKSKSLRQEVHV